MGEYEIQPGFPYAIPVYEEFVDVGKWENPFGEVVYLEGARFPIVRYYGTCPSCKKKTFVDCVIGTYADPTYPRHCTECGARNKE